MAIKRILTMNNSFNAIDWNFKELHHEVIINHHILRWCEWGLLVFCKQTSFQLAAIGTLNL